MNYEDDLSRCVVTKSSVQDNVINAHTILSDAERSELNSMFWQGVLKIFKKHGWLTKDEAL